MQLAVTVERDPHQEPMLVEELRPGIVHEVAVGLDGVMDLLLVAFAFNKICEALEELQACKRRLAALKSEGHARIGAHGKRAVDERIHDVFTHDAVRRHGPVLSHIGVKAVPATHVARC